MTQTTLLFLGLVPACLVILGALLLTHASPPQRTAQRLVLYLLVVATFFILAIATAALLTPTGDNRPLAQISSLLAPSMLGVVVLILLNLKRLSGAPVRVRGIAIILGLVVLVALVISSLPGAGPFGSFSIVLFAAPILALVWALAGRIKALPLVLSVAVLILLFITNWFTANPPEYAAGSPLLALPMIVAFYVLPGLTVTIAAILLATALQTFPRSGEQDAPESSPRSGWSAAARLLLAVALVLALAYTILWASIWDQTSDGITGVWFAMQAALVGLAAGMVLAFTQRGWRRGSGLVFGLLVPMLVMASFNMGWDFSYHAITEDRAARIEQALQEFQRREGRYPETLRELVPQDLLIVPRPVILAGESWCYEASGRSFRLGAFYREYFSMPLSLQTYAAAGEAGELSACQQRLAEMKERYDPPGFREMRTQAAEQIEARNTPVPTSEVPVARRPVTPIAEGDALFPGSWSPDSRVFFFSQWNTADPDGRQAIRFFDAQTLEICQTVETPGAEDGSGWHQRHAWLPDGRLLIMLPDGHLGILDPCREALTTLGDGYSEPFRQLLAYDEQSGRALLAGDTAYWLLDGATLEARQVQGLAPNQFELPWHNTNWFPGGERLAISRLEQRDGMQVSVLYLIDAQTATVYRDIVLERDSEIRAPGPEWMTTEELLLQIDNDLIVLNLSAEPPARMSLLRDALGLDIDFPGDISSMASVMHRATNTFHIALQMNHPRNSNLYLYHSETGAVDIYDHDTHTLLFFEDGEWAPAHQLESRPSFRDEFVLLWPDQAAQESTRLAVQGHTPREYPTLYPRYLSASSRLAFSSTQGVSLVALPGGELLGFWEAPTLIQPTILPAPDESALVLVAEYAGLYFIPMP